MPLDHALARYDRRLRAPGRINPRIAEAVDRTGRLPDPDASCVLCDLPDRDTHTVVETTDAYYVAVLNEMKGHDVRLLAAATDHGTIPGESGAAVDALLTETADRIGDGPMLAYGRMGTYEGHWHVVASDLAGEDLATIHDAARYTVTDGTYEKVWERPEQERSRTGRYIFYED